MKKIIGRGREVGSAMVMHGCNGVGWDLQKDKRKDGVFD